MQDKNFLDTGSVSLIQLLIQRCAHILATGFLYADPHLPECHFVIWGKKKKKKKEDTEQHKVQDPSQLYTSWP